MKFKTIKYLIALCFASVSLFAQNPYVYVTNNMAASATGIILKSIDVSQVTLWTTNRNTTLVYLYDGANTNVTGGYTNYVTYSTNIVSNYITTLGTTNTMTNKVIYVAPNIVSLVTNNTPPLYTIVVPGSGVDNTAGPQVTFTPTTEFLVRNKLTISNSFAGLSGVISYRNP